MALRQWLCAVVLVPGLASAAPPACPALVPVAPIRRPATLHETRTGAALDFTLGPWLAVDTRGVHDDPTMAREVDRLGQAIGGDTLAVFFGRTPIVAGTDRRHATFARPGDRAPSAAPGVVADVRALGDGEIWRVRTEDTTLVVLVDRSGVLHPAAALPRIGRDDPRPALKRWCARPGVHAIAPAPGGAVAALIVECDAVTDVRVQTFRPDGSFVVRRVAAITTTPLAPDDVVFAVAPDGAPVLAGLANGRLAIARADAKGKWRVNATSIPAGTLAAGMRVDAAGRVWTNTLAAGADGKDAYTLACDGVAVELRDPAGARLETHQFAVTPDLGVVVIARARGGADEAPWWLLAERAPREPIRELP